MPLKLLVVGEDVATLDTISELLKPHGIIVRAATDGIKAAKLTGHEKFDGIFTDLILPKLDGYNLIRCIRQSSWNTHTPVVIMAERGDTEARAQAFKAGGTFFLQKPVDRVHLNRLLDITRGFMVKERRRSKRIAHRTEITCLEGSRKLVLLSANISQTGILLETDGSLKRGSVVQLSFCLEIENPAIQAKGVVMRVDEQNRAGVRYFPIRTDHVERVYEFLAKRVDTTM